MMRVLAKGKHEPGAADQNIFPSESAQRIRGAISEIQFPLTLGTVLLERQVSHALPNPVTERKILPEIILGMQLPDADLILKRQA
jgi:hypothetical protein